MDKAMSSRSYEPDPELEPEQARVDRPEFSRTTTTSDVIEAPVFELPSTHGPNDVENPISNANVWGEKEDRLRLRLILYKAALRGDWKAAEPVLRSDKSAACLLITERGDTPLHIAALTKQTAIVQELVKYLNEGGLEFKNNLGDTAFCLAALSEDVEIAKLMYEKNNTLPRIRNNDMSPFEVAAWMGNKKMVEYLYKITPLQDFGAPELMNILVATINSEMYGVTGENRLTAQTPCVDRVTCHTPSEAIAQRTSCLHLVPFPPRPAAPRQRSPVQRSLQSSP